MLILLKHFVFSFNIPSANDGTKLNDEVFYKYVKIYFLNEEGLHDL